MFKIQREVFAWLWSPSWMRRSSYTGRLWTPHEEQNGAIAYFSDLRDGKQVSWLWLFRSKREACMVRVIPTMEGAYNNKDLRLIGASLPQDIPNEPPPTELWRGDIETIISQPEFVEEFDYIWYGFDFERFKASRGSISESCLEFEPREFLAIAKRGVL